MSQTVTCPNGHKLRVQDEDAGEEVVCPKCRALVEIPAAEPKRRRQRADRDADEAMADDEREAARAEKRNRRQAFARTNQGLGLHYFGMAIALLACVIGWIALLLLVGAGVDPWISRIAVYSVPFLLVACVILVVLAGLAECVSSVLCLWVPDSLGRGLLLGALGVRLLTLGGGIGLLIAERAQGAAAVSLLGLLLAWILWMFFLRQIAVLCKDRQLGNHVLSVLGKGVLTAIVVLATALIIVGFLKWFFGLETLQHRLMLLLAGTLLVGAVAGIFFFLGNVANLNVGSFWSVLIYPTGIPFVFEYLDLIGSLRAVVLRRS